jgi:ProP effector
LLREKLVEMFPDCFKPLGQSVVPLKVGIHRDVLAALPDISRNDLKLMLGTYVRAEGYRQGLVEGAVRFDLAGNPSGAVTAQEARWPPQK